MMANTVNTNVRDPRTALWRQWLGVDPLVPPYAYDSDDDEEESENDDDDEYRRRNSVLALAINEALDHGVIRGLNGIEGTYNCLALTEELLCILIKGMGKHTIAWNRIKKQRFSYRDQTFQMDEDNESSMYMRCNPEGFFYGMGGYLQKGHFQNCTTGISAGTAEDLHNESGNLKGFPIIMSKYWGPPPQVDAPTPPPPSESMIEFIANEIVRHHSIKPNYSENVIFGLLNITYIKKTFNRQDHALMVLVIPGPRNHIVFIDPQKFLIPGGGNTVVFSNVLQWTQTSDEGDRVNIEPKDIKYVYVFPIDQRLRMRHQRLNSALYRHQFIHDVSIGKFNAYCLDRFMKHKFEGKLLYDADDGLGVMHEFLGTSIPLRSERITALKSALFQHISSSEVVAIQELIVRAELVSKKKKPASNSASSKPDDAWLTPDLSKPKCAALLLKFKIIRRGVDLQGTVEKVYNAIPINICTIQPKDKP